MVSGEWCVGGCVWVCVGVRVGVWVCVGGGRRGGGREGWVGVCGWVGGGGGGTDRAMTSVSLSIQRTHACNELKRAGASALTPSAGLTSRNATIRLFPPKAGSRRPRWQNHPTPRRGKRLRGTPTSLPSPSEEGERNLFHLLGVGCPGSGMSCTSKLGRAFLVSRTLLPELPTDINKMSRRNTFLFYYPHLQP